jgi:hypothetical protein
MNLHYAPLVDGYGRVVAVHDPDKMLTVAPDLPHITISAAENPGVYADVLRNPLRYLVNAAGQLYVDADWQEEVIP